MDETLSQLLTFGVPIATIAVAWGGFQWRIKYITKETEQQRKLLEDLRESDRKRSHELNVQLTGALESWADATSKMLNFEERRGEQIDRNTQRSRSNRVRIEGLEEYDTRQKRKALKDAGVPQETIDLTTSPISSGHEPSGAHARSR